MTGPGAHTPATTNISKEVPSRADPAQSPRLPSTKAPGPSWGFSWHFSLLVLLRKDSGCHGVRLLTNYSARQRGDCPSCLHPPKQRDTSLACYISASRKQCMPGDHKQQVRCHRSWMIDATADVQRGPCLHRQERGPLPGTSVFPQTLTQGEAGTA